MPSHSPVPLSVCVCVCACVHVRHGFAYMSDKIQRGQGTEASDMWQMYTPACISACISPEFIFVKQYEHFLHYNIVYHSN